MGDKLQWKKKKKKKKNMRPYPGNEFTRER